MVLTVMIFLCAYIDEIDNLKRELLLSHSAQEQLKQKSITEVYRPFKNFHASF